MSHSNSSLNCFANCMAKYNHSYILHTPPCKPVSPHLTFGVMAHDVLYKAGKLRDEYEDGVAEGYHSIIPSEVLYSDLKDTFKINNWEQYFVPVIKQTAEYEQQCVHDLTETQSGPITVEREIKLQLTVEQLHKMSFTKIHQPIVGIIDCLMYTKTYAIILDYKFSSTRKSQDDFDINSQLPLYAFFIHTLYNIPLMNIRYGYIDIPKQSLDKPALLTNGTLSRAKSQNVSQKMYEAAVKLVHGDDPYYNCKPNGYYYDCWCQMALNKAAYLSIQWLDGDVYKGVIRDLLDAAEMIDFMTENKMPFLHKYDSYSCKSCEYLTACKPWLEVGDKWNG